jgi:hypothetical protein
LPDAAITHYETIGALDPTDHRTRSTLMPIVETLERIDSSRIVVPSFEVWLEASLISGIPARTQSNAKQDRRKFLNDSLLFLLAADQGGVMISRNSRDLDLLLQRRPHGSASLRQKLKILSAPFKFAIILWNGPR